MAEIDFKTIGVVLGFLVGDAGIATFKELFAVPKEHAKELASAIDSPLNPGEAWVQDRRKKVIGALLSPIRLFLSIFYLLVLVVFAYLLLKGPQNVLDSASWGLLAEPLTKGEQVLYAVMLMQLAVVYVWLVTLPACHGWFIIPRATYWLWKRR